MSRNLILIIILIIVIVGIGYWIYQPGLKVKNLTETEKTVLDPKNCTYIIEGKEVTLVNGIAEEEIMPGSESKTITKYFGNAVKADLNNDGIDDVAFLLTQDGGGSGTFYYITVALSSENSCKGANAILLGDRIAPQTTEIKNGGIIVNYADRKIDESMVVSPSIGITKQFVLEGMTLKDITLEDNEVRSD